MLPTPDNPTLLLAVAKFLDGELRPLLADPALVYRLRIACHTLETVAREITAGDGHELAELERLSAILGPGGPAPESAAQRRVRIAELDRALVARIQAGDQDPRIAEHLRATLIDRLAIDQPRFDTRLDPEKPR